MAFPIISRFPFDPTEMLEKKLPNNELPICPNLPKTKPVSYPNYTGKHLFDSMNKSDKRWHLIWYVCEFTGHLWYLCHDFDSFIKNIAENQSPKGPTKKDFINYLNAMINDSKSVYGQHILTHFDVMWKKCDGNQEIWNTKLAELREAFNNGIEECIVSYTGPKWNCVYEKWREKLISIYGDNWKPYLWQCANFDELGSFIMKYNEYFKLIEDIKLEMIVN